MEFTRSLMEEFGEKVDERLGGRVEKIILFGSYAREDNLPGSDVDLLIILNERRKGDQSIVADIAGSYFLDHDVVLSPKIIEKEEFEKKKSYSFFRQIRKEGVKVYG